MPPATLAGQTRALRDFSFAFQRLRRGGAVRLGARRRRLRLAGLDLRDPLAHRNELLSQPIDLVAEGLRGLVARPPLLEVADDLSAPPPDAAVEVHLDGAMEGRQRSRVAQRAERLERRLRDAEVGIVEKGFDP